MYIEEKDISKEKDLCLNKSVDLYSYDKIIEYIENNISPSIDEVLKKPINTINNPIFIVGCGHSGTSLLKKLLGNHSNIYDIKEESGIFFHPLGLDKETRAKIYKLWSYICKRKVK